MLFRRLCKSGINAVHSKVESHASSTALRSDTLYCIYMYTLTHANNNGRHPCSSCCHYYCYTICYYRSYAAGSHRCADVNANCHFDYCDRRDLNTIVADCAVWRPVKMSDDSDPSVPNDLSSSSRYCWSICTANKQTNNQPTNITHTPDGDHTTHRLMCHGCVHRFNFEFLFVLWSFFFASYFSLNDHTFFLFSQIACWFISGLNTTFSFSLAPTGGSCCLLYYYFDLFFPVLMYSNLCNRYCKEMWKGEREKMKTIITCFNVRWMMHEIDDDLNRIQCGGTCVYNIIDFFSSLFTSILHVFVAKLKGLRANYMDHI